MIALIVIVCGGGWVETCICVKNSSQCLKHCVANIVSSPPVSYSDSFMANFIQVAVYSTSGTSQDYDPIPVFQ